MKKILLILFLCLTGGFSFAQVLYEDLSTYTIGNIGTDITGMTAGQGGWYTTSTNGAAGTTTTNAANENFQIIDNGGTHGNVLQLTGPNGSAGSSVMWQNGLATWWGLRPAGNNIIEVEYDFFTGPPTTSLNNMRVLIYDAAGTKILAGLSFAESTKIISGVAYYDNSAAPGGQVTNYLFNLATPPLVLPANTWVRMGMSFNKTTGEVKWRGPGFNGFVMGAAAGNDPDEVDIVATAGGATNAASSVGLFDNSLVRNTATDTLLGVGQVASASLSIYPNPASDMINIGNAPGLRSIAIVDLNGRTVKMLHYDGVSDAAVDVSDLSAGMYMLTIDSDSGTVMQKVVKK